MRTVARTAVALGFVGAMAVGTTVPVMAEGIYVNGSGVHVHLGHHRHYYDYGGGGGWNTYNGCHPVTRYRVEIAHPTEVQPVGAITANAIGAVRVGRPRSLTCFSSSASFASSQGWPRSAAPRSITGYRARPSAVITDNTNTVAAISDRS